MANLGRFTSQLASSLIKKPTSRTERQLGEESSEEIERIKQRVSGMSLEEYNRYYSSDMPTEYREYFTSPSTLYAERNKIIQENSEQISKQAEYYDKLYRKYQEKKNKYKGKKRNEYDIRSEQYKQLRDSLRSQGISLAKEGYTPDSIIDLLRLASSKERREKERILASRKDLQEIKYLPKKEARYIEIETSKGKTGYIKQEQEGREYTFKLDKPLLPEGVEPSDLKSIQSSQSGQLKAIPTEKAYAIAFNRELKVGSEGNKRIVERPVVYGSEGVIEFIQNNQEAIEKNEKAEVEKLRTELFNQMFPSGMTEAEVKIDYPNVYGEYLALSGENAKLNELTKDLQIIYSEKEWYGADYEKIKSQVSIKEIEDAINGKSGRNFTENLDIDRKRIEIELEKLYPEGKVGSTIAKLESYGQIGKAVARTIAYDFSVGLIEIPTTLAKYSVKGLALGSTLVNPEKADIYAYSEQKISNAMDSTNKWLRDTYLYSGGDTSPFGKAYSSAIKGKGVQSIATATEIGLITGSLAKAGISKISQISDDVSKYGFRELYPTRWNKDKSTKLLKEWQVSEPVVLSENEILRINKKFAGDVLSSVNEVKKNAQILSIKPAKYEAIYEIYNPKTAERVRAYGSREVSGIADIKNLDYALKIEQKLKVPTYAKEFDIASLSELPKIKTPNYKIVTEKINKIGKITNIANLQGLNTKEIEEITAFVSRPKEKIDVIFENDVVSKKITEFISFNKKPIKVESKEAGTGFLASLSDVGVSEKEIEYYISKPIQTSMKSKTISKIEQDAKEILDLTTGKRVPASKSTGRITLSGGVSEVDIFKVTKKYEKAIGFNQDILKEINIPELNMNVFSVSGKNEPYGYINQIFKAESSEKVPILFKARDTSMSTIIEHIKPFPETPLPKLPKNPATSVADTIKNSAEKINNVINKFTQPKVKESHFKEAISDISQRKAIEQIWENEKAIEYTDMLDSLMPSSYGESRAIAGILGSKLNIPTNIGLQNIKTSSALKLISINRIGNMLNNTLLGKGKVRLKERAESKIKEKSRQSENLKTNQVLRQIQKSLVRTKSIQRTKARTRAKTKAITSLKAPSISTKVPKMPKIRVPLPKIVINLPEEEPKQKKKKITESKIKKLMTLRYVQDFTSKMLNLKPKTIRKKDLAKYIQTGTPLSIRRALKVK